MERRSSSSSRNRGKIFVPVPKGRFQCGDNQVNLVVIYGVIKNIEPGQWAYRYLHSEDATIIFMKPDQHDVGIKQLIWQVAKAT